MATRGRDALAAVTITLLASCLAVLPPFDLLHGWSIDVLTALRWRMLGERYELRSSPTVVVALDEESYRTPPFKGSPTVTWTNEIGRVLTSVVEGGARVVGADVVFPTSIEQSEIPFGEDTLGVRLRGFDRDFLRAIALAARAGKLVLGEVQLTDQPILPAPGQRMAVGQRSNIRALNVHSDSDEVVRRIPLTFMVDGRPVSSLAVELAARARSVTPDWETGKGMTLAGYRIPTTVANTLTLNFEGGSQDIPTYSLADLRACAEQGNKEFFRRNFDGKVVLIGVMLEVEDRKLTSKRFATAPEGLTAERCVLPAPPPAAVARRSIAGTYIHATAVNNLLRRDALIETGPIQSGAIAAVVAGVSVAAALALAPAVAVLSFLALAIAWAGVSVVAFEKALVLPFLEVLCAGYFALVGAVGYRLIVTDKDKRFLRSSFALYLAPAVIEKMLASSKLPSLGGETRNITAFFSDIADFSLISETMSPADLVVLMNTYLSAMTDIIEQHGGFVDKFIGDAIVGVFGAPVDDADHASQAVRAALACCERLAELNRTALTFKGHTLAHRIGLNTGETVVGNIGSRRRFNYTVIGDAVNLASRLEVANKYFGTSILVTEATLRATGTAFRWREIDLVRVKGHLQPLRIYEPLGTAGQECPAQLAQAEIYSKGLACWRDRDFAGAVEMFASIAPVDPPSALFMQRARRLSLSPPGPDWEPISLLDEK